MDPIGTITKDFSFLDEPVRRDISFIMDEAKNYWDFVHILSKHVALNECPPLLVFFSLYHASRMQDSVATQFSSKTVARILESYPNHLLAEPFRFPTSVYSHNYADAKNPVELAIKSTNNIALQFYLWMRLYRASEYMSIEETNAQSRINRLLAENEQLRLLSADYYGHTGYRMRLESNPEGAFEHYKRALRLARESDDQWHQSSLLTLMGEINSQFRAESDSDSKTKQYLGEAMGLAKSLGDQIGIATILENLTVYSIGRGELGEALDCTLEAVSIKSVVGGSIGADAYNLAMIYGELEEGKNALEWAKTCTHQWGPTEPYTYLVMAFAYSVLGRYDDAQVQLNTAKELILREGLEMALGQWHSISGKLERARGNLVIAEDNFKQALVINERASRWRRVRRALYDLSLTELDLFKPTAKNKDELHSGPWMKRFEKIVWEHDIPGYLARLMLLKAELRLKQERLEEANQLLDSALELTDDSTTRFLHQQTKSMKEKWIAEGILPSSIISDERGR